MLRHHLAKVGFALALLLALVGCSGGSHAYRTVSLAELAEAQEQWDGRLVHTRGTVRTFAEPLHYWIEDADHNRVELLPHEEVAALVGTPVEVTGRFTFREGEGRRIAVDEVSVLRSGPG